MMFVAKHVKASPQLRDLFNQHLHQQLMHLPNVLSRISTDHGEQFERLLLLINGSLQLLGSDAQTLISNTIPSMAMSILQALRLAPLNNTIVDMKHFTLMHTAITDEANKRDTIDHYTLKCYPIIALSIKLKSSFID
jgi:hypothetical protein